ncbi:hypothetical protein ACFVZH_33215 [Streptomyces sp. NPDC059534]|uniref:hypothetical protein n=1 Tax=Streptomyces sp. NPDC059534 TaxID=3346859 RepID=UPI00369749E6
MTDTSRGAVEHDVWTWQHPLPLKYVLVSEEWDGERIVWAHCADADGLFVAPSPRRERLTLTACAPTGRLRKAVERLRRDGPVDLGALSLAVDDDGGGGDYWELTDAVILDHTPSTPSLPEATASLPEAAPVAPVDPVDPVDFVDLVIEAEVHGPARQRTEPADVRWLLLNGPGGSHMGDCGRIDGLYVDRPHPRRPPLRLIGCRPGERLLRRLVHPRADGDHVTLLAVDRSGRVMRSREHLTLEPVATRPSVLDPTLVDLWLREGPRDRPAPAVRPVWDAWFEGPPTEPGSWTAFPPEGRAEWAAFAAERQDAGRPLPDPVRHLDGRHVTDVHGLTCALGEAFAGPGGHYHQCWAALRGCRCGGERPPTPFTLVWHHSDIARRALAPLSVDTAGDTPYFDAVLQLLTRVGITVRLR